MLFLYDWFSFLNLKHISCLDTKNLELSSSWRLRAPSSTKLILCTHGLVSAWSWQWSVYRQGISALKKPDLVLVWKIGSMNSFWICNIHGIPSICIFMWKKTHTLPWLDETVTISKYVSHAAFSVCNIMRKTLLFRLNFD